MAMDSKYMVQVVDDAAALTRKQGAAAGARPVVGVDSAQEEGKSASNSMRWENLSERLRMLVRMQKQWGSLVRYPPATNY